MSNLVEVLQGNSQAWSDIKDHLPLLFESARGNVLEIGVRSGVSTSALLAGVEKHGGHLWSVDVNNCNIFDHPQWTFIQADSITQKDKVLEQTPESLDVLFVDGDHTFEGCLSDLETFGPRANLILVHDCECPDTFPGVRKAFDQFAAKWAKASTVISGSYGMGVIDMCRIQKAKKIAGWMTEEELIWLARAASRYPTIVEVGSYQGQTTRVLADNTSGHVYAVDDWKGLREEWWINETPAEVRDSLFERFSANVSDLLKSQEVIPVVCDHAKVSELPWVPCADLIFIDGDHSYQSVKRDIETWLPFLNPGGMMCGHDANQQAVMQAVNEMLPGNKVEVGLIWAWTRTL